MVNFITTAIIIIVWIICTINNAIKRKNIEGDSPRFKNRIKLKQKDNDYGGHFNDEYFKEDTTYGGHFDNNDYEDTSDGHTYLNGEKID